MEGAAGGLRLFPAGYHLPFVACGLAFATGTSWGTFGILDSHRDQHLPC